MGEQVKPECDKDNLDEEKREDYEKLLEGYNQYVESYNKLNEECAKMTTERDTFIQTIKSMEEQVKPESEQDKVQAQKVAEYDNLAEAYNQYVEAYNRINEEYSKVTSERDALNQTIKSMEEQALPCPSVVQDQQAEDYNKLLEAYNQYVESYNKLNDESMKLAAQNEEFSSTIKALEQELENKEKELLAQVQEPKPPTVTEGETVVVSEAFDADLKGWGEPEEDVLQGLESAGQPSDNNAEVVLQLEAEISDLRQKIRSEQGEKAKLEAKLNEELNAAKVKHGKLTLKVKQLSKELKARKSASPASATSGLGDDNLDKAIQDELNERANKVEKSLKEAQSTVSELNAEKSRLLDRVDTLEAGNEKFMELKESQDREVQHLRSVQQELNNQVGGFEW